MVKKHKSKLSAKAQGEADFNNGLSLAFCPFDIGKPERAQWQDGWFEASDKAHLGKEVKTDLKPKRK